VNLRCPLGQRQAVLSKPHSPAALHSKLYCIAQCDATHDITARSEYFIGMILSKDVPEGPNFSTRSAGLTVDAWSAKLMIGLKLILV